MYKQLKMMDAYFSFNERKEEEKMFRGIGVSPGIVLGQALIIMYHELKIEKQMIGNIQEEEKKFFMAIDKAKDQFTKLKNRALKECGENQQQIFEAYLMALEDPAVIHATIKTIREEKVSAAYAVSQMRDRFIEKFETLDNEYMRERASDIKDVANSVIGHLLGIKLSNVMDLEKDSIFVAHDITLSDITAIGQQKSLGFLTDIGGKTSHAAIVARTLGIPGIVGLKNITENVKSGDFIIFNGETGEVIVNPDEKTIEIYQRLKRDDEIKRKRNEFLRGKESKTLDGKYVKLTANMETPQDVKRLIKNDAEGVGLYRTEFLYMHKNTLPSEQEQFEAYKTVLEALSPKTVVIRTLDIGGDKKLSCFKMNQERNAFLGKGDMGLRFDKKDILKTQLRALLRASIYGNLKIMFPMIGNLEEFIAAKQIFEEAKEELDEEMILFKKDIEVGIVIEIPSAAIISDILAKHVDFFSIGTNDLFQYTCAVDRTNEGMNHTYNPLHPAILRLIKMIIDNGHKEGIEVAMCGEMAGDITMIPILLGLGLDEFSMRPVTILSARKLIRSLKYKDMKKAVYEIMEMATAKEVAAYVQKIKTCHSK